MTIKEILQIGKTKLKNVSQTSSLDVEVLVGHVLELSHSDLILKDELELNEKQEEEILGLIERRAKNEPIAYLTNQKEFYGLEFYVDENVLIPRPETEVLVERVIEFCGNKKAPLEGGRGVLPQVEEDFSTPSFSAKALQESGRNDATFHSLIVDVGTGSGCIPISLAKHLENVDFIAIDISEKALNVARINLEKYQLGEWIKLRKGNLLEDFTSILAMVEENVVITANLPYVEDEAELESDVKDYEPHLALFSGKDGLNHSRKLLVQLAEIKPLAIFLEIDPKQVEVLKEISEKLLSDYEVEVVKDLDGKDRVFVLKRK